MESIPNPQTFESGEGRPIQSTSALARRLGLSRWTVSRVINGHAGIHPETVRRVRAAMQELGFAPNPLAQGLRKGRTNIIGVCLPEIEGFYLGQKLEFLRRALAAEGYHVMIGMTNGDVREEAEALGRFRLLCAAGVILVASKLPSKSGPIRQLHEAQVPLVLMDPMIKPPKGSICVDRTEGMRQAMRHLLDLGHRRVATLGFTAPDESRYTRMRVEGIATACRESGLPMERIVLPIDPPAGESSHYAFGYACAAAQFAAPAKSGKKSRRPTAVLVINDRVAVGLIDGLRRLGIRVPEEVSIVGYDNMEMGAFLSPRLTTIDAQPDELVARTTSRLLLQINHPEDRARPSPSIPTRLIIRESTAPVSRTA